MEIKIINANDFSKTVLESATPTVVDFYADWCGPCRALSPVLEQVQEEVAKKAKIVKVNIDNNMELARKYMVMSVPTMVVIKNGKEVGRISGLMGADSLVNKINSII